MFASCSTPIGFFILRLPFLVVTALFAVTVINGLAIADVDKNKEIHDTFDHDTLNTDHWCPCQIKNKISPVRFPKKPDGDPFLRIMADEASLGGNTCEYEIREECTFPPYDPEGQADETTKLLTFASPAARTAAILEAAEDNAEEARSEASISEDLGPSLILKLRDDAVREFYREEMTLEGFSSQLNAIGPLATPGEITAERLKKKRLPSPTHLACIEEDDTKFYCDRDAHARADQSGEENTCIQRQELRIKSGKRRPHAVDEPMWYSLRFRMPSSIEDTCNSVRWVTAQWKHKNAALKDRTAPQSPLLAQRFDDGVLHVTIQDGTCRCIVASARDPRAPEQPQWASGKISPKMCSSRMQPDGCSANLTLEYSDDPVLSNPLGEWTTMSYYVKADRGGNGEIKIWQDDRRIVTITGDIGYEINEDLKKKNVIKFKFGHYRDYMPFHHEMDVDFVRIGFDPPNGVE